MPIPTFQHSLVVAIIVPTFLVFFFYLVGAVKDLNAKWRANKERRKQRKAAHNVRLSFDTYGYIVKDTVDQIKNHEIWERILGHLHTLGPISLGNLDLMRHHSILRSSMDDADKYRNDIHDALAKKNPDRGLMSSLQETEALLDKLRNRETIEPVDTIFKTLNKFEGELKRVAGQKHTAAAMASQVRHLEPTKPVKEVNVRRAGLLHHAVEIRDRFDIGSRRVILAIINLVLTVGLVRFLGFIPAAIVGGLLLIEVLLDLLQACEHMSFQGFLGTLKVSWAGRISAPIIIALMMANFILVSNPRPMDNTQLEEKGTFLEPPPQYNLEKAISQTYYVPAIFGIMHGTLLVLILVPLPLCYRLQTRLVTACPRLRFLVPENPVWLHRMLGYAMLAGLIVGAAIWIVFQSLECLVFDKAFACIAFDPPPGPGLDVFRLRFLIVWPFTFFFIPLMASPTYPDFGAPAMATESVTTGHKKASAGGGCPFPCFSDREKAKAAAKSCTAKVCACLTCIWDFTSKRVLDIFLVVVPFAGILLTLKLENKFLSWYIVTPIVCIHMLVKFRSFLVSLCPALAGCLGHSDEGPELFQRFWWEIAYAFHATAFSLVIAAALLIRFEIFFVALGTWGLYFLDRGLGFVDGCRNTAPILVGSGPSSCVITKGDGKDAQPAYVRLLVKKPENFVYKAGQWAHVGFNRCGSYRCLPRKFPLALQWHAFSIASCEYDDFLEFHIQVHGKSNLLKDDSLVTAATQDKHYAKISRKSYWIDWLFPFYTPFFGKQPSTKSLGSSFKCQSSGVAMTLTSTEGSETVRMMKPSTQWTGKLFNAISWLQDQQSRGEDISNEFVQIMGPYGTLPFIEMNNSALMLIGAGVGFPSMGSMLRKILEDNVKKQPNEQKPVCFIWTATKLEQLLLCFPGLLSDLARYVQKSSIANLKSWLTVKIFISSFDPGKYLSINPSRQLLPEERSLAQPLTQVRRWLLGQDAPSGAAGADGDGTYLAQGSLGGSFADIFRNSLFIKQVIDRKDSLGVCFCGPSELCSWIRTDISNTILPVKVEFASEVA